MASDSHSKMGVGKKIKKMFSFKKKKEERPAIEHSTVEKSNTLNGTKPKSSSLASITRKFSFGKKDKKDKKDKKGVPAETTTTTTTVLPSIVVAEEKTTPISAAAGVPKIVEAVPVIETTERKAEATTEPPVKVIDEVSSTVVVEQPTKAEDPPLVKQEDVKDENASGDGIKSAAADHTPKNKEQQSDELAPKSNELEKLSDSSSGTLTPGQTEDEPKTITEVINKIHDKSETNQTGSEFVRTVEVEQERTLAEDGTTVISRQTKTTTTTVDRDDRTGNVSQVKTEIKKEVMPRACNGQSRQTSQQVARKSSNYSFLLVFGFVLAAFASAIFYKYYGKGTPLV